MRPMTLLAALGLVAAIGACGSDDGGDDAAEDFRKRGGAICRDLVDREILMEVRNAAELRRVEDVPSKTDPIEARKFRRYESLVKELADGLEPLEPNAPDERAFRVYLDHLAKLAELARSTSEFLAAHRGNKAIANFGRIARELEKAEDVATRLTLEPCAELSNPAIYGSDADTGPSP